MYAYIFFQKISEFNSQPQGKNGAGFSWLVFDGNVGSSMEPRASSGPYFTLTDRDRETVCSSKSQKTKLCLYSATCIIQLCWEIKIMTG